MYWIMRQSTISTTRKRRIKYKGYFAQPKKHWKYARRPRTIYTKLHQNHLNIQSRGCRAIHNRARYLNNRLIQSIWQLFFFSFYWSKTIEREKGRESKNRIWVWQKKLSQISFLFVIHIKIWRTFSHEVLTRGVFNIIHHFLY